MKKIFVFLLSAILVCAISGCASGTKENAISSMDTTSTNEAVNGVVPDATAAAANPAVPSGMEETLELYGFEGVVYAVKNGQPVASFADGELENGKTITLETPMPIGSVSKQFCAAAILLLQEQGKLNVSDTLDKYYPEYPQGNKVSLHNLLSMRSGIPELTAESGTSVTVDHTEAENVAVIKEWVFSQPLMFEPDEMFAYTNVNYFLLADIVEQVSGRKYIDFLREHFFAPLGMNHTGSIGELVDAPTWAQGNTYQQVDAQPGLTKGAGDIIANAADITAWINALSDNKVISADSYRAMTTDYSSDVHYGYGMFLDIDGGIGHFGAIGIYSAFDYVNTDEQITLVVLGNTIDPTTIEGVAGDLLIDLMP